MVAEARFTLKAEDQTKEAFDRVQNSLKKMGQVSNETGKALSKNLDLKDAARTLATVVGLSVDKIADKFSRWVTGQDEETQKLQESLVNLGEEGIRAQAALFAARSTEEQQVERLISQRDRLRAAISAPATDLAQQVEMEKKKVDLYQTEVALLAAQKAHMANQDRIQKDYAASVQAVGALQGKVLGGDRATNEERIIGLRSKEAKILQEIGATEIANLERRTELNGELATVYQQMLPLLEEQKRLGADVGNIISQGFEDAILAGNGLRDVVKGIAQDLLRLFVRQQITTPLASGIGSFFNGLMGRAAGGPVSSGTPYMVGEKGPEIFVPRGSGTIIPNHALGGSGGGSAVAGTNVNVTYNIAAGVTKSELMPILETERKRLKAEIPDMVRRGGAYRGAFA